jgi:hypothetical protein
VGTTTLLDGVQSASSNAGLTRPSQSIARWRWRTSPSIGQSLDWERQAEQGGTWQLRGVVRREQSLWETSGVSRWEAEPAQSLSNRTTTQRNNASLRLVRRGWVLGDHKLQGGVEVEQERKADHRMNGDGTEVSFIDSLFSPTAVGRSQDLGAWMQDDWTWSEDMSLKLGLRGVHRLNRLDEGPSRSQAQLRMLAPSLNATWMPGEEGESRAVPGPVARLQAAGGAAAECAAAAGPHNPVPQPRGLQRQSTPGARPGRQPSTTARALLGPGPDPGIKRARAQRRVRGPGVAVDRSTRGRGHPPGVGALVHRTSLGVAPRQPRSRTLARHQLRLFARRVRLAGPGSEVARTDGRDGLGWLLNQHRARPPQPFARSNPVHRTAGPEVRGTEHAVRMAHRWLATPDPRVARRVRRAAPLQREACLEPRRHMVLQPQAAAKAESLQPTG